MSERQDPLGRTLFEHARPDGAIEIDVAPGQHVCDFCLEPDPTWTYPCGPVDIIGHAVWNASDDEWAACEHCHDLIETGTFAAFLAHAVRGQRSRKPAPDFVFPPVAQHLHGVALNLRRFLDARTGPPYHHAPGNRSERR